MRHISLHCSFFYFYNKDNNQLINTWWAEHLPPENLLWKDNQFLWAEMTLKKTKKRTQQKERKIDNVELEKEKFHIFLLQF